MFIFNVRACVVTRCPYSEMSLTGVELIVLSTCVCSPAPTQLVSHGFFPWAPLVPTLAVDIEMLQFLHELFVRVPPNNTAWTETLEAFWAQRQCTLNTRVSLLNLAYSRFHQLFCSEHATSEICKYIPVVLTSCRRNRQSCHQNGRAGLWDRRQRPRVAP